MKKILSLILCLIVLFSGGLVWIIYGNKDKGKDDKPIKGISGYLRVEIYGDYNSNITELEKILILKDNVTSGELEYKEAYYMTVYAYDAKIDAEPNYYSQNYFTGYITMLDVDSFLTYDKDEVQVEAYFDDNPAIGSIKYYKIKPLKSGATNLKIELYDLSFSFSLTFNQSQQSST
ncbi:MAG: hypothetical protein IKZ38_00845 [Clostridia bacterium]|nr:hypothetical protein [Clostridia bacterium]